MRHHTPRTLFEAAQALHPGCPICKVGRKPDDESEITVTEWRYNMEMMEVLDMCYTSKGWYDHEITFYYSDATFTHFKL